MSFWTTSEGDSVEATGEYEAPSGSFEAFPDKTDVMAYIDEIKWQEGKPEYGGGRYVNYRITVNAPECYKGRKSYFKLWVDSANPNPQKPDNDKAQKQVDKDKRLLAAMATNAGGGLMRVQGEPTDEDLARELTQKMMVFKLGKWEMESDDGQMREGNYVMAISPASKGVSEPTTPPVQNSGGGAQTGGRSTMDDDEIPF